MCGECVWVHNRSLVAPKPNDLPVKQMDWTSADDVKTKLNMAYTKWNEKRLPAPDNREQKIEDKKRHKHIQQQLPQSHHITELTANK